MKIELQRPNITRVAWHQEPGDEHYGSCLWAYYDFDLTSGILTVQSDCGYYHYRWPERGDDFLHLMAGVDSDYLTEKLLMCVNKPGRPQRLWVRRVAEIYEEYVRSIVKNAWNEREAALNDT